jgi:hypothetical protein
VSGAVQSGLISVLGIPPEDFFQIMPENGVHARRCFITSYPPSRGEALWNQETVWFLTIGMGAMGVPAHPRMDRPCTLGRPWKGVLGLFLSQGGDYISCKPSAKDGILCPAGRWRHARVRRAIRGSV